MIKPYILSPAGSYEALVSAINAGADEVYFGFGEFNARYNAKNFDEETAQKAINLCRILDVKTNITVNTLVTDREIPRVLDMVYKAACMGADAFIVQDLGLARCIKQSMPELCLHASTQCACHNTDGVERLAELGFSRVVLAREMQKEHIQKASSLGVETEIFVHGALCVCHSGQCLMSSAIGQRSGNRGLCAQPCRLPYSAVGKNTYPLSLKDLSLSNHVEEILELGVTSLKIEGRMKSPDYVYGTTKIWRELIDNAKNADKEDMRKLENLFSRQGFTDKYFTGQYRQNNKDMYGVRTEQNKIDSRQIAKEEDKQQQQRKQRISIFAQINENEKATVKATLRDTEITVQSDFVCPTATLRPLDEAEVKKSLVKLGNTPFCADENDIKVEINGNVFLSKSMLNELRRSAVEKLENKVCSKKDILKKELVFSKTSRERVEKTQLVYSSNTFKKAQSVKNADIIFVAISEFDADDGVLVQNINNIKNNCKRIGVRMPRVVFDDEMSTCKELLLKAKQMGACVCEITNIGHINIARQAGFELFASFPMNVYNSSTIGVLEECGFDTICASSELNEAQIRDLAKKDNTKLCAFVKGYLPLMVLESCIIKANGACKNTCDDGCLELCDRIGKNFKIYGEPRLINGQKACRNIILNAVETDILKNSEKMQKMNVDMSLVLL